MAELLRKQPAITLMSKLSLTLLACGLMMAAGRGAVGQQGPQAIVLGIAQDGGYPQAGCRRECCQRAWRDPLQRRFVSCLAIVDPQSGQRWMLDCTPDFREQLQLLDQAFLIQGPERAALYLPDIDKWEKWDTNIENLIHRVDVAFVDATFFDSGELPGRDMSEIPHPFIVESLTRFSKLPATERSKIQFIHLNHSNPALDPDSPASATIRAAGHQVAEQAAVFPL